MDLALGETYPTTLQYTTCRVADPYSTWYGNTGA
jgi:hypothetical protein